MCPRFAQTHCGDVRAIVPASKRSHVVSSPATLLDRCGLPLASLKDVAHTVYVLKVRRINVQSLRHINISRHEYLNFVDSNLSLTKLSLPACHFVRRRQAYSILHVVQCISHFLRWNQLHDEGEGRAFEPLGGSGSSGRRGSWLSTVVAGPTVGVAAAGVRCVLYAA